MAPSPRSRCLKEEGRFPWQPQRVSLADVHGDFDLMDRKPLASVAHSQNEIADLRGELCALRGITAVLIAHLALLGRDPHARREEILRSLESMLPQALAQIEHNATPAAAAGFERAVETVTHLARKAVRFDAKRPIEMTSTAERAAPESRMGQVALWRALCRQAYVLDLCIHWRPEEPVLGAD